MSYEVILPEGPKQEIIEIANYIRQDSPQAAERWTDRIFDAIATLETFPEAHSYALENRTHSRELRNLLFGKYRIIFFVEQMRVIVVSIRHSARLPHEPGRLDDIS